MRVCLLASGSKGNSLYIEAGETKFLIDAGLSAREILHRLSINGIESSELNAIFISHEHTDHIRGAGTLARRLGIPVIISYPTHSQSREIFKRNEVVEFESGCSFSFRDTLIDPFPITHDSEDPVGFVIDCPEGRIGAATDLGIATRLVKEKLKGSRVLVLESNHDEDMLLNGPYPWHLKQRIKSRHGHLSNGESVELLDKLVNPELEAVFLAHLSEVNNDPEIAMGAFRRMLEDQNVCDPRLVIGNQYVASEILNI
ncbi:MAG TPA: MBL fold metallo-hydrolase [Spirochaetota bacterium]